MCKTKLIFLIPLFIHLNVLFCQSQKIDSLKKTATTQVDTSKAATLIRLGWELYNIGEYATAQKHLAEAKIIAIKTNFILAAANCDYINGIIEMFQSNYSKARKYFLDSEKQYLLLNHKLNLTSVYNSIGVSYFREGEFDKSLQYSFKALKMNEELGKKTGIAATLTNIGGIYFIQGKVAEALDCNFKSLKIEREIGNKKGEAASLTTIGIMFQNLKQFDKSIVYFNQSLKICNEINDKAGIANCIINIANTYSDIPDTILGNKKAMENYQKSLLLFEELGDKSSIANCYAGIGTIYGKEHQFKKAINFMLKAIKIEEEINDAKSLGVNYGIIGKIYFELKEIQKAIECCNRSVDITTKVGDIEALMSTEQILSDIYLSKNDATESMKHYKRYIQIKDSIYTIENKKNADEIQAKYETEIKEKENKELNLANTVQTLQLTKNKFLIISLIVLLIMCLITAYVVITQSKLKHKQESIVLEQKLLRSQMNPHFIFNALNAIESYIYKNEPKEAGKYLSGFAGLMRLILENSREEYVTLEKEIQTLEYYLNLQKLRFDNSFSYKITVDNNIDISSISIPPMLAQPFIENSIEHGLKNSGRKGEITLHFYLNNNELVFESCDNGIGFEKAMAVKNTDGVYHKSLATTITLERLKNLNRKKSKKIKWIAEDIKDQLNLIKGTRVVFTIPYTKL